MKIITCLLFLSLVSLAAAKRLGDRVLYTTECIGSSLAAGSTLQANQSICTVLANGETLYFGIVTSDMPEDGYTMYEVKLWSSESTYDHNLQGVGTQGPPPILRLQRDGNLVFDGISQSGGCLAKPQRQALELRLLGAYPDLLGDYPDLFEIVDTDQQQIMTIFARLSSRDIIYYESAGCYPNQEELCVDVLQKGMRLSWKEYLCDYDSSGKAVTKFGLDHKGFLKLIHQDTVVWHPGNRRGDFLHFQRDGHLTLYTTEPLVYSFVTLCIGPSSKITIADGDVHQFDDQGQVLWTLRGSLEKPEAICFQT
jgi:hypothetical protein